MMATTLKAAGCSEVCKEDTFIWTIKNVIDCSSPSDINFTYATFEMKSSLESTWKFQLEKEIDFLTFCIDLKSNSRSFSASFSISLLDSEMNRKYEKTTRITHLSFATNISSFLSLSELLQHTETLFHDGDLILLGKITIFRNKMKVPVCKISEEKSNYTKNMRSLMELGTFSDFTVMIEGKKYPCHKVVLASRSQYFDSLLSCDMKEKRENLLILEDIESSVFEQVLMYIYTEELDITNSNVIPLLSAAEKYMLYGLKEICQESLLEYCSSCNLPIIEAIADFYQLHDLAERCHQRYTMFTAWSRCGNKHDALEISEQNAEDQITCNKYAPKHNSFNFKLHAMQQNARLPSATMWIATNRNIILQREWTIRNKDVRKSANGKTEDSKSFIVNEKFGLTCLLDYKFYQSNFITYFLLYFKLISFRQSSPRLHFRITIDLNYQNSIKETQEDICVVCYLHRNICIYKTDSRMFKQLGERNFTINCIGWFANLVIDLPRTEPKKYLTRDLTVAYKNTLFSDLTIKVKERKFQCHKAIVSCRSRFLARRLNASCENDKLELLDLDPDSFQKILSYIYSDDYEMTATESWDVLPLACHFELDHLKSLCENCLARDLTVENAVETFHLSLSYSALALQECSLRFVRKFLKRILLIPGNFHKIGEYNLARIIFSK